jgi:hypothetical protein
MRNHQIPNFYLDFHHAIDYFKKKETHYIYKKKMFYVYATIELYLYKLYLTKF